ncbi:putative carbohydrate-binding module family 13 protein [Lyophyllum shimeji]|uniref:Carbohydrate-binding module family 13 protein n=1 Tax=Lyophyllum shimeji TaxID=47721 RepID=A0A9P3PV64_LYOSH|nr:putative carbohydrate-binding module family 13 protein [Lyophyllum shimeji]
MAKSSIPPVFGILFLQFWRSNAQSATYLPSNAPDKSEAGQAGTNRCGTAINQTSNCQNAYRKSSNSPLATSTSSWYPYVYLETEASAVTSFDTGTVNSVTDWCIWAPPEPGSGSVIGNTERIEVAWCIKRLLPPLPRDFNRTNGTGARLIPDGTISGAHFVQTPDFVQVTGVGNLTFLNVPAGDAGGELDPHGQDGLGNPIGGLVFSSAFGQLQEITEWTNFISDTQFCFRACKPGPMAPTWCQHIYDEMGCAWNMPANYNPGVFENCKGDSGQPMGIYGSSTFRQGEPFTPAAHPAPSSSSCTSLSTIGNGLFVTGTSSGAPVTTSGASTLASRTSGGASPTGANDAVSHMTSTDTMVGLLGWMVPCAALLAI